MADLTKLAKAILPPENDEQVRSWLETKADADHPFLLAHADDGVIWGKRSSEGFFTSHDDAPDISPVLSGRSLQQAFVFGNQSEIRLFRDATGKWQACEIIDASPEDTISETLILWGDEVVRHTVHGFTRVRNKVQQGMDQALPIVVNQDDLNAEIGKYPRLLVRHFIEYDRSTGEARIGLSRLVDIDVWSDDEEKTA